MKHYEWCLLLDKVSHLEQKHETMISKVEDRMIYLREEEFVICKSTARSSVTVTVATGTSTWIVAKGKHGTSDGLSKFFDTGYILPKQ